jgi:enamine deaminase RidA (YjgF/YER057c/UK114 family)
VYLQNLNMQPAMDAVYESYFKGALPARTVVGVSQLPRGALVEISAIAGK